MLTCQKDSFSLPQGVHYLNAAYMSPLTRGVEEAGIQGLRRKRDPSGITADDFFRDGERVRQLFADLVNVRDPNRVAIIAAASYGLAVVSRNTPVARGQRIVVLHEQFPSNLYTWQRLAEHSGATLTTVTPPPGTPRRAERWNERILEAIDGNTALVALPAVHWADGTLFDLEAIGERARSAGAAFVIDGTQSVGALPFDVEKLRPDALVCAAYKWLMGPYGIGVAYFGPRYADGVPLEENWISRFGSENFSRLVDYETRYQPGAIRFDVGERSNFILLPMLVAALEQVLAWGVADIQAYCRDLCVDVLAEAQEMGYRIEDPARRSAHLFGVRAPDGLDVERLRESLTAHRISASVRGSAVRISPHVYNDEGDIEALRDALAACVRPGASRVARS